jgi:hypothetical protein
MIESAIFDSIREAIGRARSFFRQTSFDRDFDAELGAHPELAVEENTRNGMSPDEARRQALFVITALLISVRAEVVSSVLPCGDDSTASKTDSCTVTDCEMASTFRVIEMSSVLPAPTCTPRRVPRAKPGAVASRCMSRRADRWPKSVRWHPERFRSARFPGHKGAQWLRRKPRMPGASTHDGCDQTLVTFRKFLQTENWFV